MHVKTVLLVTMTQVPVGKFKK